MEVSNILNEEIIEKLFGHHKDEFWIKNYISNFLRVIFNIKDKVISNNKILELKTEENKITLKIKDKGVLELYILKEEYKGGIFFAYKVDYPYSSYTDENDISYGIVFKKQGEIINITCKPHFVLSNPGYFKKYSGLSYEISSMITSILTKEKEEVLKNVLSDDQLKYLKEQMFKKEKLILKYLLNKVI